MPPELRRDVRLLTTVLGDAIVASRGQQLLDDVEALRRATIALGARDTEARTRRVGELVAGLDIARAEHVVRAFTCYFQLVNLAEERQRIRVLRARTHGPRPLDGSIAALGSLCCNTRSTPAAHRRSPGASCSTCGGRPRRSGSISPR